MEEILFFAVAFISEIVGTTAGFGSSTIFLPLALFFLDFKTALVLVAFFHLFGNVARISFFKHGLNRKLLMRFGVPSVLLSLFGALIAGILPPGTLKFSLAVFLMLFSVSSLLRPEFRFPVDNATVSLGGGVSGFLTGAIGTGGALRATFLTGFGLQRFTYIATSASIAIATDVTRIPVYVSQGFLNEQFYYHVPVLFAIAMAGSYVGKRIVEKLNHRNLQELSLIHI